jgi:hypothetical protein
MGLTSNTHLQEGETLPTNPFEELAPEPGFQEHPLLSCKPATGECGDLILTLC